MSENKKNIIPLVLAVILALSAVFAVNRLIDRKAPSNDEAKVSVVVALQNLNTGDMLVQGMLGYKNIPVSAASPNIVRWNQVERLLNQTVKMPVSKGDYIGFDDVENGENLSDKVGNGEWAVSISLNGGAITSRLHPNDEIAIIGTFTLKETKKSAVVGQETEETSRKVTLVILPCVRILALDGNRDQGGDQFVLALSPSQAQMLLAAQEQGISLSPALRKPHDESARNRTTVGLVDEETFNNLADGVGRTLIPQIPSK